ncbi:MAG TPA: sensor histidine kinase [Dongiaceae bacterium]|nr:sensor histidine kinase [Dongiaceae bacterium]
MIGTYLDPLRRRLSLLLAIVLLVPTAFGVVAAVDHYRSQVEEARRAIERYATLASSNESNLIWQSERIAEDLGRDPVIQAAISGDVDLEQCRNVLKTAIGPYPAYAVASLLAVDGRPVCRSTGSRLPSDAAVNQWFADAVAGHPSISGYTFAPALKQPILVYGTPVKDAAGHVLSVIGLAIRLDWLASTGQEPGLPPEASVVLLDRDGKALVTSDPGGHGGAGLPPADVLQVAVHGGARSFDAVGADGVARNYAVHAIAGGGLFVVFGQPTRTVIAPLQRDLALQISILALVVLGGLAAALIGSRLLVTRWIAMLREEARTIAAGEPPPAESFAGAPIEIRELNETLLAMAARIQARESELSDSLAQKQMMLREIHHRVKNNLQTVTSLLNLYARIPRGEAIKQAFADVQTRINALALVHRHLYESQDLREIDLAGFMTGLCRLVQDGCGVPPRRVQLHVDIPTAPMAGDRAVPLALLTTEILTNAFKHAFPENRAGAIEVRLSLGENGMARLVISDNGVGTAERAVDGVPGTMGQTLIGAFTRQLGGTLATAGPPGTAVTLDFALAQPAAEGAAAAS